MKIEIKSLTTKQTKGYWWAKVVAKRGTERVIGTRRVPITEPYAISRAVLWAQQNAINQLKKENKNVKN